MFLCNRQIYGTDKRNRILEIWSYQTSLGIGDR